MVLTTLSALFSVRDFNPWDRSAAADTETHTDTEDGLMAAEWRGSRKVKAVRVPTGGMELFQ